MELTSALRLFNLTAGLLGITTVSLQATPANKQALVTELGEFLDSRLNNCAICHVGAEAHGAESLKDFPHNAFGKAVRAEGSDLEIRERLAAIANADADGDGVSNLDELLAGSAPGSAKDSARPSEDTIRAFAKFQQRYPWRPFQPVIRPPAPELEADGFPIRNEIDAFIAAEFVERGLTPRPRADRDLLLRRVSLDLIGLIPTAEELAAFREDSSEDAYEKAVDRLFENPAYGERWGRHWMDIWRYSDWAGYKQELRNSQRHIWHWRDWIIESLNAGKPYDQMVMEMLAGDEIAPTDPDTLRATGFLARNYFRERDQWMDDVVTHTSQGFMGLTMGCVKCHDHMYDPLPHEDYYAMRAIFESYGVRTDRVPGELDIMKNGLPRAFDQTLKPVTYLYDRGDERYPIKENPIAPGVPAALGGELNIQEVSLPTESQRPWRRPFVIDALLTEAQQKVTAASHEQQKAAAAAELKALQALLEVERLEEMGEKDSDAWKTAATQTVKIQREAVLLKAEWDLTSDKAALKKAETALETATEKKDSAARASATKSVASAKKRITDAEKAVTAATKATNEKLSTKYTSRGETVRPAASTGRRLAFAEWLTRKEHPLTARVAMNHLWARHFGQAIVPTTNEFGANGRPPSHPALLDWMAAELMEQDWDLKAMHRLIVTSSTYQLSGTTDAENHAIDPDNLYHWRWTNRRMEGELVRDNLLWVAGRLDQEMGGPDIPNTEAQTSTRRSIYLRHAHEKLVEFIQIFDGPKVTECYMRDESVQPHQALALANSPLTHAAAEAIAADLAQTGQDEEFIESAFLRILSREPDTSETALCLKFLNRPEHEPERSRQNLVLVLLNHNDFVTVR